MRTVSLISLLAIVCSIGCKKDPSRLGDHTPPPNSKEEMLTVPVWDLIDYSSTSPSVNDFSMLDSCFKDNHWNFYDHGICIFYEGEKKCFPTTPDITTYRWLFNREQNVITLYLEDKTIECSINILTKDTLQFTTKGGNGYMQTHTYSPRY